MKVNKISLCIAFFILVSSAQAVSITTSASDDLCDYRWYCSDWKPENCVLGDEQFRTCRNIGDCSDDFSPPLESKKCAIEKFADLIEAQMKLESVSFYENDKLVSIVILHNNGEEKVSVDITYNIFDDAGNMLYTTVAHDIVDKERVVTKRFDELELENGIYYLTADVIYDGGEKNVKQGFEVQKNSALFLSYLIWFVLFAGLIFFLKGRLTRKKERKIKRRLGEF